MNEIGLHLKKARKSLKLSQDYVANELNIPRSAISQIECGNRKVSSDELKIFCKIYGITADEFLNDVPKEINYQTFLKRFQELDETDQNEVLNFIDFKYTNKERKAMEWVNYMIMAASHSKNSASHWFRYLRKDIDKYGSLFSKEHIDRLYNEKRLTPFQRISLRAAFKKDSHTHQHIVNLNQKVIPNKIALVREKYENS